MRVNSDKKCGRVWVCPYRHTLIYDAHTHVMFCYTLLTLFVFCVGWVGFVDYDIPRTPIRTLLLYKFPAFDWLSNFLQIFSFLFFRSSYSLNCDPRLGLNLGFIGSRLLSWEPSSYHFIWNWTIYMGTGQFQGLFASSSQYWSELGSSSWISKELGTVWGNWPVPAYFRQFQPIIASSSQT